MATPPDSDALSVAMASEGESVGSALLVVKSSSNASVISMVVGSSECDVIDMAVDSSRHSDIDLAGSDSDSDVGENGCISRALGAVPRDSPRQSSLSGAFRWPIFVLLALQDLLGNDNIKLSMLARSMQISSHFSGVGSAAVAAFLLHAGLSILGLPSSSWHFSESCEKNRTCQKALLKLSRGCVFTDMYEFCPRLPPFAQLNHDESSSVRKAVSACFQLGPAWCARHKQRCQPARNMDGNVTGSPCQPWSRAGTKKGVQDPRSMGLWIWIAWVQAVKPLWAIHENVCGFRTSLIDEALGCSYKVFHIQSDPCHLGFTCIRRPRIYSVLLRKGCVRVVHDLHLAYTHVRKAASARGTVPLSDLFFATPSELLEEENRRRQQEHLCPLAGHTSDWSYLLTKVQVKACKDYMGMWQQEFGTDPAQDDSCLFDLNQNPLSGHRKSWTRASTGYALPTLRFAGNVLWSPKFKRWLLPLECASAMGWPVRDSHVPATGIPPCNIDFGMSQLGNSMHIACVGTLLAVTLACTASE